MINTILSFFDVNLNYINLFLGLITTVILLFTIFPLAIKEVQVKNGLAKIRGWLLEECITILIANIVGSVFFLWFRHIDFDYPIDFINLINKLSFLYIAILKYKIYHDQYTPENKKRHTLMEGIEKGKLTVVKNKKGE